VKKTLFLFLLLVLMVSNSYAVYSVAIDVGHFSSGRSRGAIGASGTPENEYNKKIATLVKEEFERRGMNAFLIEDMDLKSRAKVANLWGDVLLSIHHDSVSENLVYKAHMFGGFSLFISKQNPQFNQSLRLAKLIGSEMINNDFLVALHHKTTKQRQRLLVDKETGVYRSDKLVVIKETKIPAVLVECGVIKNLYEECWLLKPEVQEKLVLCIVNGTENFMKNWKNNEQKPVSKTSKKKIRRKT
jgi:N-acetylmuramoyl-L-alanine amidase